MLRSQFIIFNSAKSGRLQRPSDSSEKQLFSLASPDCFYDVFLRDDALESTPINDGGLGQFSKYNPEAFHQVAQLIFV